MSTTPGASAVTCSVHDLALFSQFVMASPPSGFNASMPSSVIDAISASVVNAGNQRYAMGWWMQDDFFGYRSIYGSGGTTDASATLRLIPSEQLAIAALANTGTRLPEQVVDEVLDQHLPQIRERRAQQPESAGNAAPASRPMPVDAIIGTWTGIVATHQGDRPFTISIASSGEVHAAIDAEPRAPFARGGARRNGASGVVAGDLRVDDAPKAPYDLQIGLELIGDQLVGFATTRARPGQSGPTLSFWVKLRKQ